MKRIAVCLVALGLLVGMYATAFAAYGPDDLTVLSVGSYAREREVRLLGGWWMYRYKMNVTSTGKLPLAGVCGQVRSSSSSVKVIDPEVCFPEIPAGGSATSKGTFTIWTNKRLSGSPTNLSWIYSSLKITADPSPLAIQKAAPYNALSYYVTLSTSAPKKYYVLFHQAVPEGITITEQSLLTREMNQAGTWRVTEFVSAPVAMESDITARAWILNTLQQAEVTVPVSVTPTPPPPQLGILRSWPPALGLDTPTDVSFTIAVSGVSLPASLDLQQQISGAWQSIGALTDSGQDGDVHQGDGIYAGVVRGITASQEGTLMFRAVAPTGISAPYALTVTSYPTVASDETRQVITLSSGQSVVGNRILVNFLPGITRGEIESTLVPVSGTVVNFLGSVNAYQVEIATANEADLFAAIATLKSSPRVVTAEPVVVLRVAAPYVFINKDTYYDPGNEPNFTPPSHQGQWDMKAIKADEAWTISKGANVTIAVLDTGVDANHEDLSGQVMARIDKTGSVIQGSHGTGVAGIIAAKGDNGKGIAGMAWESKIVDFQVCKNDSDCDVTWVIPALAEATSAPYHAKVINMSLYFTTEPTIPGNGINLSTAISDAAKNAIIVVAAGNANNNAPTYPGAYGDPIAVTASKEDGTLLGGSTFGDWVDLAAPGSNIVTLKRVSGTFYYAMQPGSTSYAAPHVSGAAALLWTNALTLSSNSIRARLLAAAEIKPSLNNTVNQNKFLNAYNGLTLPKATADITLTSSACIWNEPSNAFNTTYNGSPKPFTATTNPPGIPYTITYNGSFTTPANAGTYTVVATINNNPYYEGSVSKGLIIGKATATINIDNIPSPGTAVVGGYFDPTFATPSSGTVSLASNTTTTCTVNPSTKRVSYIGTGHCTLQASITEGTNHQAATGAPQSFTIDSASLNPPTGFHIVTISSSSVILEWSAGAGLEGYNIYYGTAPGTYGPPLNAGSATTWTINGLTPGLSYYFAVTGVYNVTEETGFSQEKSSLIPFPGTLDPSFSTGGFVVSNGVAGNESYDEGYSITVDPSGRILVTGVSLVGGPSPNYSTADMVIWCYDSNGNPCSATTGTAFGTNGIVVYNGPANKGDAGNSITVDPSGRILVAGQSRNGEPNYDCDMVIWRYLPDGALDTAFGSGGIVVHNGAAKGNGEDYGYSITVDPSGRILVTGVSINAASNNDMVIWCYDSYGAPCDDFGINGIVVYNGPANKGDAGNSITVDPSGRILVTGVSINAASNYDMVIWCYDSYGAPCDDFGINGIVVYNGPANKGDAGNSITVDPSGRILVTGYSINAASNNDMVIWCYDSYGAPCDDFGINGIVAAGGDDDNREGYSITLDSSDRLLVAGWGPGVSYDMVIWRYLPDGTLDATFGSGGIVAYNNTIENSIDKGYSITVDSYGHILVTGYSYNSAFNSDMVIWRYLP